mgnify:CR=1 FL=1
MTYRIGKIFMIVLQTVVVCVEQVFYVPTYNTERDSFLLRGGLSAVNLLCNDIGRSEETYT